MDAFFLTVLCISFLGIGFIETLECYNCSTDNIGNCHDTIHCLNEQSCYMDLTNLHYTLGCIDNRQCILQPQVATSLVGRALNCSQDVQLDKSAHSHLCQNYAVYLSGRDLIRNEQLHCFECCSNDICNKHLCDHPKPTSCIDDPKLDCAFLDSKFNICQSIHEAKTVCPKFCSLCSLVDGSWASWAEWSTCDVTCGNGTQSRNRNCNNPSPAYGGLNCPGSVKETVSCSQSFCPIDGGWTEWYSWSLCDVTCDNGIQTRARSCSNPVPDFNGQNCTGISFENKQCSNQLCSVDGGWTQWSSWDFCTASCGFGIQRRHRNCTNPVPKYLGQYCLGDTLDVQQCQLSPCPVIPTIAFRSRDVKQTSLSTIRTLVFTTILLNAGNGYDSTTGIFKAPVAGTYSFSTHLCLTSSSYNFIWYAIVQNDVPIERGLFRSENMYTCHTVNVVTVLRANDTVCVKNEGTEPNNFLVQDFRMWNTFSGVFIR